MHRIGRTGRAGSMGQATSFYTDRDMVLLLLLFATFFPFKLSPRLTIDVLLGGVMF